MSKEINVLMNDKKIVTTIGTPIEELLNQSPHPGNFPALGAVVNSRIDGLYYRLKSDSTIKTIDLSSQSGMEIYRRTAGLLLIAALTEIDPKASLEVGQSIGDGYFYEIKNKKIDQRLIDSLQQKMHGLVSKNLSLIPHWVSIEEAIFHFKHLGRKDKVMLLEQSRSKEVPLVEIGKYRSHTLGPVASKTSVINKFRLYKYQHGLVLDFPNSEGKLAKETPKQTKLFNVYIESKHWNEMMHVRNIAELNEHCIRGTASELVKISEAFHEKQIGVIADHIARRKQVKLILVAGPSGSGKTTFSKRLSIQLRLNGIEPIALSIDNYYLDRCKSPRHADGSYNFECMEALDLSLFNKHIAELLSGKKVDTPCFSFVSGRRDPNKTKAYQLHKNQVLIIEGIHGLNDKLSRLIPPNKKFKIYVSALTQVCVDNHNRIFTSDARLIRRLVRDRLFRNWPAAQTIEAWPSVRAGENRYIFPFQEEADVMFDSSLPYEQALLKPYTERFLMEIPRESPAFFESLRLYKFLNRFIPILDEEVPHTSILREFIGGSAFRY